VSISGLSRAWARWHGYESLVLRETHAMLRGVTLAQIQERLLIVFSTKSSATTPSCFCIFFSPNKSLGIAHFEEVWSAKENSKHEMNLPAVAVVRRLFKC
jgi:hypothetical protein